MEDTIPLFLSKKWVSFEIMCMADAYFVCSWTVLPFIIKGIGSTRSLLLDMPPPF